jgi:G:T/U-mismatch repair DNA glycosylase
MRQGLPPMVGPNARLLLLGRFPSERSLPAGARLPSSSGALPMSREN